MKKIRQIIKRRILRAVVLGVALPLIFGFSITSFGVPSRASAAAGVPTIISYQGRLADASGSLLGTASGTTYFFKFSIWDASTAGAKLWPSTAAASTSASVTSGVFSVNIGDTGNGYPQALDFNFEDNDTVFLQVEVASSSNGTYEAITPRQRIASAAYALNAKALRGFVPSQLASGSNVPVLNSGNLTLGGVNPQINATGTNNLVVQGGAGTGDLILATNGGRVGIGTASPSSTLHVVGDGVFSNGVSSIKIDIAGGNSGVTLQPTSGLRVLNSGANAWVNVSALSVGISNTGYFGWSSTANADTAPDTGLARNAAGVVRVTDGSTGVGSLVASTTIIGANNTPSSTLHVVGSSRFTATSTFAGNVGIGTTAPSSTLHVMGLGQFGTNASHFLTVGDGQIRDYYQDLSALRGTISLGSGGGTDIVFQPNNTSGIVRIDNGGNAVFAGGPTAGSTSGTFTIRPTAISEFGGYAAAGRSINIIGGEASDNGGGTARNGGNVLIDGGLPINAGSAGNILLGSVRGNVGIGTASPSSTLHVIGNTAVSSKIRIGSTDFSGSHTLGVTGTTVTTALVATTYDVGGAQFIDGLNTPYTGITIHGRNGSTQDSGDLYLVGGTTGSGNGGGGRVRLQGGVPTDSNTAGGDVMVDGGAPTGAGSAGNILLGSVRGNVGIGTASPSSTLHVVGGSARFYSGADSLEIQNGSGPRVAFGNQSTQNEYFEIGAYNGINNIDTKSRDLKIATNAAANTIYIAAATGRVGIGTSSPATTLHVAGAGRFGGDISIYNGDPNSSTTYTFRHVAYDDKINLDLSRNSWIRATPNAILSETSGSHTWTLNNSGTGGTALMSLGTEWIGAIQTFLSLGDSEDIVFTPHVFGTTTSTRPIAKFSITHPGQKGLVINASTSQTANLVEVNSLPSVSGGDRFVITAGGNVGIGAASPSSTLHVVGTSDQPQFVVTGYTTQTSDIARFVVNNSSQSVVIDSTGALVNNIADCGKYVLKSGTDTYIATQGCGARLPYLGVGTAQNASFGINLSYSVNSGGVVYGLNSNTTNTGNGGIGGLYTARTINAGGQTTANAYGVYVDTTTVASGTLTNNYGAYLDPGTAGTNNFGLYQPGSAVRNYFAGNVGIGTTVPSSTLHVVGTSTFAGNVVPATSTTYDLGTTSLLWKSVHVSSGSIVVHADTTNTARYTLDFTGTTGRISSDNATPMQFTTAANQGIRIDTSGNVGIGVAAPGAALDIGGATRFGASVSANNTVIDSGALLVVATAPGAPCNATATAAGFAAIPAGRPAFTTNHIFYNTTIGLHSRITAVGACADGGQLLTLTDAIAGQAATDAFTVYMPIANIGNGTSGFFRFVYAVNYLGLASTLAGGFDVAEQYPTTDYSIEAGDIVTMDTSAPLHIKRASAGYDSKVVGVVSTNPALTFGNYQGDGWRKVALTGRVPVKISFENGLIEAGDSLTTSATRAGYAMKMTESGMSIGMALEAASGETKTVMVMIRTGWHNIGASQPASAGNLQGSTFGFEQLSPETKIVVRAARFGEDALGEAEIEAGQTRVDVTFSQPYEYKPIVTITPTILADIRYAVTNVTIGGFSIEMSAVQGQTIGFNWHAFESAPSARVFISGGSSRLVNIPVVESPIPPPVSEPEGEVAGESVDEEPPSVEEPPTEDPPTEPAEGDLSDG